MKRQHVVLTAAVLSAALLLTACDKQYGVDYSKKYNDYLAYSLGSDYQMKLDRSEYFPEYKLHSSYWNVNYHDKTGAERSFELETYDYKESKSDETYSSEQMFDDCTLLNKLYEEAGIVAEESLKKQLIAKVMDSEEPMQPEEGVNVSCFHLPVLFYDDALAPVIQEALNPQTGLQVCKADMQSLAQDPNVLTVVSISLVDQESKGIHPDPEFYVEKMQQIYEEYLRENENPQNYYFVVNRTDKGAENEFLSGECLFEKAALTGIGEFDPQERYADVTDVSTHLAIRNELIDIRSGQSGNA